MRPLLALSGFFLMLTAPFVWAGSDSITQEIRANMAFCTYPDGGYCAGEVPPPKLDETGYPVVPLRTTTFVEDGGMVVTLTVPESV